MRLLLDTQILVWMVNGDRRYRPEWLAALGAKEHSLHVSAATAFEFTELQLRRRLPVDEPMDVLIERFDLVIEPLPADCWCEAASLPRIHRDPIDRMLVAHARMEQMTLVTSDTNIRRYPVTTL